MPTDPSPRPPMPPSVRVAVGVMAVLALLLLANAALLGAGFDVAVDRIVEAADDVSPAEARTVLVWLLLVPALFLGTALVLAAALLLRRHPWARLTGLTTTGLMIVYIVVTAVLSGGIPVSSLLLLVLSIAGLTSLLAGTTRAWLSGAERPA